MGRATIQLDKRRKLHNGMYNLVARVNVGNDMIYLNIDKLSEQQYNIVFNRRAADDASVAFRGQCENYRIKCERLLDQVKPFDKKRFRELFYEKEKEVPKSLVLKDLFIDYVSTFENIKLNTRIRYRTTGNILETYKPGLTVFDINPNFLRKFESDKIQEKLSPATVSSYLIDIRRILNYYTKVKKIIPLTFEYPFGEGKFQIKKAKPPKEILENKEIRAVVRLKKFDSPEEENARDLWLLAYRCNGSNYVDLLKLRWDDVKTKYLIYYREKTRTTQKTNKKPVVVPLTNKVQGLLNKLGKHDSPFVLGLLKEGYSENTIVNKSNKDRAEINLHLKRIGKRLGFTAPLRMDMARHCYASTLDRAGVETKKISNMLVHSSVVVTEQYLAGMNTEELFKINKHIL